MSENLLRILRKTLPALTLTEWLIFGAFVSIGLANILSHELWRDEFQAFLIAKESASLPDLFERARYEGHPPLWFISLYAITRFTADPLAMQLFHLLIACACALLILKLPAPAWLRYPLVFGYFNIYEYLAISRNYSAGLLLSLVLLHLLTAERRNHALIALALFLLCFTSVYGMIMAAAIGFYVAVDSGFLSRSRFPTAALCFVLLAGMALSAAITLPPPDSAVDAAQWFSGFDFTRAARVLTAIWKSYAPVPELNASFWDTNLLESRHLRVLMSLLILICSLLIFLPRRNIFLLYCFGTFSLFIFSYFKFVGYLRHQGHFFILFMMCIVLMGRGQPRPFRGAAKAFIMAILVLQISAGAAASFLGWTHPFTAAKAAARYIKEQGYGDCLIMGDRDYALTSLSGYLGQPVLHLSSMRFGTYIIWNADRTRELQPGEIADHANRMAAGQTRKVLVVLNYPLPPAEAGNLVKIAEFTRSVKKDETYFLYTIDSFSPPLF
jgi:hypothetical protein